MPSQPISPVDPGDGRSDGDGDVDGSGNELGHALTTLGAAVGVAVGGTAAESVQYFTYSTPDPIHAVGSRAWEYPASLQSRLSKPCCTIEEPA